MRGRRSPLTHLLVDVQRGESLDARDVLVDASRELEVHAPSAAGKVLAQLVTHFPAETQERQQLVARAAHLLLIAGQFDDVDEMIATERVHEFNPEDQDRLQVTLAQLSMCRGDLGRALELTDPAVRDARHMARRASLLAVRAHVIVEQTGPEEALRIAELALRQARALGNDEAEVLALTAASESQRRAMDFWGALASSEEAVKAATQSDAVQYVHPELWHARALLAVDRVVEAEHLIFEGQALSAARGTRWATPLWHLGRAELSLAAGRVSHSLDEASVGLAHAERHGFTAVVSSLHLVITRAHMGLNDLDEACAALRRAEYSASEASPALRTVAKWTMALLADLRGRRAQALRIVSELSRMGPDAMTVPANTPYLTIPAARMLRRLGAEPMLMSIVEQSERVALSNPGVKSRRAMADHVRGLVDGDLGAVHRAQAVYEQLGLRSAAAAASEDVAHLARSAHAAAQCVEAQQHRQAFELISATEQSADTSAGRVTEKTTVGAETDTMSAQARFAALTSSERRVLEHVVNGSTNREIARRLFLSPHTVDSHLRHIFAKVGVSNRVQLSRAYFEAAGADSAIGHKQDPAGPQGAQVSA